MIKNWQKQPLKIGPWLIIFFVLFFCLRAVGLFSPYFGLSKDEALLLNHLPAQETVICENEGDCFLPFSAFVFRLPYFLGLKDSHRIIYWGRTISLLAGMIVLILGYRIVGFLTKKADWPLFFLLVLGLSPQFIFLSRFISPLGLGLPFFLGAIYFLLNQENNKWLYTLLFFLFWGVSWLTSLYLFLPSLFLLLFSLYSLGGAKQKKFFWAIAFLFLGMTGFVWWQSSHIIDFLLLKKVFGFFSDIGFINAINSSRGNEIEFGHPLLARFLYNKLYFLIFWLSNFFGQYSLNKVFSLMEGTGASFLFDNTPMLLIFAPLFVWGLFKSFRLLSRRLAFFTLGFLLLAGISSSLLGSSFNQDAFTLVLLPIAFYISLALSEMAKKKSWLTIFGIFLVINCLISYFKIFDDFRRSDGLPNRKLYQIIRQRQ